MPGPLPGLGVCREGDTSPRSRRRLLNFPLGKTLLCIRVRIFIASLGSTSTVLKGSWHSQCGDRRDPEVHWGAP